MAVGDRRYRAVAPYFVPAALKVPEYTSRGVREQLRATLARSLSLSTERRIAFVHPNVGGIRGADAQEGAVIIAKSRLRRPFLEERFLLVTWARHRLHPL